MKNQTPISTEEQTESVQVKLTANDAHEAVKLIQEKYGSGAKVLSVNQREASGLKRLLAQPQLEIIVSVPKSRLDGSIAEPPHSAPAVGEEAVDKGASSKEEKEGIGDAVKPPIARMYQEKGDEGARDYFSEVSGDESTSSSAPLGTAANPVRRGSMESVKKAIAMLKSVGFDDSLIERIRYELDFKAMGEAPTVEIYGQICDWLCQRFPSERSDAYGDRRAFIGACGAGKTSALCKSMSADVFVNGLNPVVLKVDSDVPNPSDGLEAFCQILDAPLYRSIEEIEEISRLHPIYVDLPGLNFTDRSAIVACNKTLDAIGADERILVVNAAYESDLIAEAITGGLQLGATKVIFTHLDETRRAGKLWKFVLSSGLSPLFLSYGANPAGDYTMDPFSYLLERTFPNGRSIAQSRRSTRRQSEERIGNREVVQS